MTEKPRIAVFAGTTEGRQYCEKLARQNISASAFVATKQGAASLESLPNLCIHVGRLDKPAMLHCLAEFDAIVDATHPFACEVSRNLKEVASELNKEYHRIQRSEVEVNDDVIRVADFEEAARYLAQQKGHALLTIGIKELANFCTIEDFDQRLYVRVLPHSVEECLKLGFSESHIIAMQGPFSHEENIAHLKATQAAWLVTKESGKEGGLPEKISAAQELAAQVIMIDRPKKGTVLSGPNGPDRTVPFFDVS